MKEQQKYRVARFTETYSDAPSPSCTAAKSTNLLGTKSFDDLPEDMVATILEKHPAKDIYHGRFVCKAWDSIITTHSGFRSAFNEYFNKFQRRPWFLLLDQEKSSLGLRPDAVYNVEADAPAGAWCQIKLKIPVPTSTTTTTRTHNVVISSGGLMCAWSGNNNFIVSNPFIVLRSSLFVVIYFCSSNS